jgi:hypothetical protein
LVPKLNKYISNKFDFFTLPDTALFIPSGKYWNQQDIKLILKKVFVLRYDKEELPVKIIGG